jgi:hypothetical protein
MAVRGKRNLAANRATDDSIICGSLTASVKRIPGNLFDSSLAVWRSRIGADPLVVQQPDSGATVEKEAGVGKYPGEPTIISDGAVSPFLAGPLVRDLRTFIETALLGEAP